MAAEGSFQKLIIKGRRLNVKWGKSQAQQGRGSGKKDEQGDEPKYEPVPGLPGGKFEFISISKIDFACP